MDPDKLAERDRARRLRQLKNAKLQGLALISCLLLGLAWALISYFGAAKKKKPQQQPAKPEPAAVKPAADAPAPPPAEEPQKTSSASPMNFTPVQAPPSGTIRQTPPGMTRLDGDAKKPTVPVANVLASIGVTDSEKSRRALPKVQEAKRVIELLGKTSHISGKLEYLIMKPGLELRMKEYYERLGLKEPEAGEQMADFEIQTGGERYLDVVYKSSTRPAGTIRASFLRDEKGMVRLDWESFVGFGTMGMREFRDGKPETPVTMRVFASVDDYFNYEFSDPKKYLSVRLRNGDGSEAVNGYCELGGRVATAINARLATSAAADAALKGEPGSASKRAWAPIIVKIRFPSKAQSDHCVELMELMHGQWLAPAGLVE